MDIVIDFSGLFNQFIFYSFILSFIINLNFDCFDNNIKYIINVVLIL